MERLMRSLWAQRLAWSALILSLGAIAAALIAAVGSGQGAWHFRTGFLVLRIAFFAAVAGGVVAIVALAMARKTGEREAARWGGLALIAALLFTGYLGMQVKTARTVPAIHDITTDLNDVPRFRSVEVRADNLDNIPDLGRADLRRMPPEERWKAIHREAYGDIQSLRVPWTVEETIEKASQLAQDRGWEIAFADPKRGEMEATDTTFFFRFKDDVVLRARKAPEGGTIVDMRSISRVGASDVGVNARRIRDFLNDLRQS